MTTSACPSASLDHPTPIRVSYRAAPPAHPGYHTSRYIVTDAHGAHVCTSKTPFYSAARALLKQGHDPLAILFMHTDAGPDWSLRAPIGKAAKLTVQESATVGPRIVKYDGERLALLSGHRQASPHSSKTRSSSAVQRNENG